MTVVGRVVGVTTAGLAALTAAGVLATLTAGGSVAPPASVDRAFSAGVQQGAAPPYDRAAFGPTWADVDRNGCDTRNDVLARDLTDLRRAGCTVLSGSLRDPYSGTTVAFVRTSGYQVVQVDHVRALRDAWVHGAHAWTPERRLAYANDPSNLLPTTLNSTKGDREPAELLAASTAPGDRWRPSPAGACTHARAYALTSTEWALPVDPDDAAALAAVLRGCP